MNNLETFGTPAKLGKPLWRRIARWSLHIVLALGAIVVLAWSVGNYLATRALEDEIDEIRAAGQPLTFRDLYGSETEVNEADDASRYYRAALALALQETEVWDTLERFHRAEEQGGPPSPGLLADAQRLIEDNRLALEMVDRGSDLPECTYNISLEYGIAPVLPRLSEARYLEKVLLLRTKLLAAQGQGDRAVESALSSLRMTRMFDREPVLICHLVKVASVALTLDGVPLILEAGKPSTESLQRLDRELIRVEQSMDMRRVWMAERVYALEIMRNLVSDCRELQKGAVEPAPLPGRWPRAMASSPILRISAARTLRMFSRLINASTEGWPELLDATKADVAQRGRSILDQFGWIRAPADERATVMTGRCVGKLRAARASTMIEQYRRDNGRLPESLGELRAFTTETVPLDPFTGRNLVYAKSATGYLVYSVGDDREDDRGDEGSDWGLRVRTLAPDPL